MGILDGKGRSRVGVGLKEEFNIVRPFGRNDRQPTEFSGRQVIFFNETQNFGVKSESPVLVIDGYAVELDFHRSLHTVFDLSNIIQTFYQQYKAIEQFSY